MASASSQPVPSNRSTSVCRGKLRTPAVWSMTCRTSVDSLPFPEAKGVVNTYPIVAIRQGPNITGAAAFIAYVTGPEGKKVLEAAGFGTP